MNEGVLAATWWLPLLVALGVLALLALLGGVLWWHLRRQAARSIPARLRHASKDLLSAVLVPHVEGGHIYIEHLLLTPQGVIVMELRDVSGHVFGSEGMQEWTVLDGNRRATFGNPLPVLYDRMAAVSKLIPEVPVHAVVAFTATASFSKGYPPNVVMLDSLLEELGRSAPDDEAVPPDLLEAAWKRLSAEALSASR